MEKSVKVLPARCARCGEIFDLGYDFDEGQQDFAEVLRAVARLGSRSFLCWNCRV